MSKTHVYLSAHAVKKDIHLLLLLLLLVCVVGVPFAFVHLRHSVHCWRSRFKICTTFHVMHLQFRHSTTCSRLIFVFWNFGEWFEESLDGYFHELLWLFLGKCFTNNLISEVLRHHCRDPINSNVCTWSHVFLSAINAPCWVLLLK